MENLKNILVGFATKEGAERFINEFTKKTRTPAHTARALTKSQAQDIVAPQGDGDDFVSKIKRFVQSHLGGGPAEFIRDVREMDSNDRLILIHTDELSDADIEIARSLATSCNLVQAKHFGGYSVEHLTFKKNHDAEMQGVSDAF